MLRWRIAQLTATAHRYGKVPVLLRERCRQRRELYLRHDLQRGVIRAGVATGFYHVDIGHFFMQVLEADFCTRRIYCGNRLPPAT